MLLNARNHTISVEYDLTNKEYKFLVAISNNKINTYENLCNYIFGHYDWKSYSSLIALKSRLLKKVKGLQIDVIENIRF